MGIELKSKSFIYVLFPVTTLYYMIKWFKILNLRSSNTLKTVEFTPPWYEKSKKNQKYLSPKHSKFENHA